MIKRIIKRIKFEVEIRFVKENIEQSNQRSPLVYLIKKCDTNMKKS